MKRFSLVVVALLLNACSSVSSSTTQETITDDITQPVIENLVPPEDSIIIEWAADNMDRGQYDYYFGEKMLVVDPNDSELERGDVIYFHTPEFEYEFDVQDNSLARVVGLPGETIEIKEGHVFIDDKKFISFYSQALNRGLTGEEYFEEVDPSTRINDESWKEYFATTMKAVEVPDNTVFVLGDNWWRSVDSREFGPVPEDVIIGKVLGYEKKAVSTP
ncbi:signal peptidase I [Jeotgalibacillus proteolyticus]|uniref:Signal peptidase I n=1 Tax=Jeotgalibacillus proteolyticus TaxID=2082395 RepID=A0A2S5G9A7_9BACL|nr:signal peptidase I [Jeotgalibacillus proteolyticus]PPA69568.1 signal peptidase I [Jeotgalibacillus proteolyticus]